METITLWGKRFLESPLTATRELDTHLNKHYSDPRTVHWPMVNSIAYPVVGIVLYLLTVRWLLPRYMRSRPAFDLKTVMLVYNIAMVVLSVVTFYEFVFNAYMCGYYALCTPHYVSYNPREVRIAFAMWLYYISKYIELLDTVFMVLRKRDRQVSFLHLYHHAAMLFLGHVLCRFGPTGQGALISSINAFIHIVMYGYYAASPFKALQPYLWWKRYVTQLQLIQFFMQVGSTSYGLLTGCTYHPWMAKLQVAFCMTLIVLFTNFYVRNYQADKIERAANKKKLAANGVKAAESFTNELNEKPITSNGTAKEMNGGLLHATTTKATANGVVHRRNGEMANGKVATNGTTRNGHIKH